MIRVCKMSGKFYAMELPEDDEKAMEEIRGFVEEGTPVTIYNNLDEANDVIPEKIIYVEREDD